MLNPNFSKPSVLSLRPVVQPVAAKHARPATINMPQSMTVFNLKEISSKLKHFKAPPVPATPPTNSPTVSFILNVLTSEDTPQPPPSNPVSEDQPISPAAPTATEPAGSTSKASFTARTRILT